MTPKTDQPFRRIRDVEIVYVVVWGQDRQRHHVIGCSVNEPLPHGADYGVFVDEDDLPFVMTNRVAGCPSEWFDDLIV